MRTIHHVFSVSARPDRVFGAALDWSTLTAADSGAEPDRYVVQLRPGADAEAYAAAVWAREPDFLQACRLHVSLTYGHRPSSSILLSQGNQMGVMQFCVGPGHTPGRPHALAAP